MLQYKPAWYFKPLIKTNVGREWAVALIAYSPTETVIMTIADTIVLLLNVALRPRTPAGVNYVHDEQLEVWSSLAPLSFLLIRFCFSSSLPVSDICAL